MICDYHFLQLKTSYGTNNGTNEYKEYAKIIIKWADFIMKPEATSAVQAMDVLKSSLPKKKEFWRLFGLKALGVGTCCCYWWFSESFKLSTHLIIFHVRNNCIRNEDPHFWNNLNFYFSRFSHFDLATNENWSKKFSIKSQTLHSRELQFILLVPEMIIKVALKRTKRMK